MGIKGDKLTQDATLAAEELVEKLSAIEGITSKKMFGGHGLFHADKMFGLMNSQGEAYLKVDQSNRADFEQAGGHQHGKMPYFSIPVDVRDDQDLLIEWANKSITISK